MNSQHEQRLEAEIDRELRSLAELEAPSTLIPRVRAAIAQRSASQWYRQPWHAWPAPMRAAALAIMAGFFASLCFGAWRLPDTGSYLAASRHAAGWISSLATLWNALNALLSAFAHAIQRLGGGILPGCLVAMFLAWAICLGLGTACLRFALARRQANDL
jgi:hypothetical protein